mmetsp:Transcript_11899/g.18084  ORF Transcript_11899/g.18084 Transcript_11899/m.18084 type:complete len:85 (-) Transcript_11899:959-1213(-)
MPLRNRPMNWSHTLTISFVNISPVFQKKVRLNQRYSYKPPNAKGCGHHYQKHQQKFPCLRKTKQEEHDHIEQQYGDSHNPFCQL